MQRRALSGKDLAERERGGGIDWRNAEGEPFPRRCPAARREVGDLQVVRTELPQEPAPVAAERAVELAALTEGSGGLVDKPGRALEAEREADTEQRVGGQRGVAHECDARTR